MSGITTCRRCGGSVGSAHVTERGTVCPHCAAPLGDSLPNQLAVPDLERDVERRRDLFLWLIGGLLGLGAAAVCVLMLLPANPGVEPGEFISGLIVAFALIDLGVILAVLRWALRGVGREDNPTRAVILSALLIPLVIVGVVVVGFMTCAGVVVVKLG
jgi:hypothetical protein